MARVWLMALLVMAACTKTWTGHAVQPNPLIHPTETLMDSEAIVITTHDMELQVPLPAEDQQVRVVSTRPYPLENAAAFSVVSRDRLRFHVQLEHKWQDWADPAHWEVYLVDDQGRRWVPESVEHGKPKHIVTMWDQEVRSVERTNGDRGDIVAVHDDGYRNRQFLGNLSVFRGRADFEFYERDIFSEDVKSLTLVVRRPGYNFQFRWDFRDDAFAQE